MKNTIFVSTAIPYVNAPPHLGFALEAVLGDVYARHARRKHAVCFISGTDENSLKNVRAAEARGTTPRVLVDANAARYRDLGRLLDLSYDDFVRTSADERHREAVATLWKACASSLYRKRYEGRYCVGCEAFLVEKRCSEHGAELELVEEDNWFFRLSDYRAPILELLLSERLRIHPRERRNEALRFLEGDVLDVSVSRSRARARGWGLEVPGDPESIIYVWFDALASYIAGAGLPFWTTASRRLHLLGKGILRFHAVLWPAILLAAGLPLPTDLWVHGYVTIRGEKIAKSRGNVIDPSEIVARYGTDALRWFLLRHVGGTRDADVDRDRIDVVYRTELADGLGNLVARTTSLLRRCDIARLPDVIEHDVDPSGAKLASEANALAARVDEALERFAPEAALSAIAELIASANKHIAVTEPWVLAKDPAQRPKLAAVLSNTVLAITKVGEALHPFLPTTAEAVLAALRDPTVVAPLLFPKTPR